jgi:hypothetical protein
MGVSDEDVKALLPQISTDCLSSVIYKSIGLVASAY